MPEYKVQALGITRWSYPGLGSGFRKLDDDLAVLRAKLYAPNRLEHRLFLLEHLVLPCLKAQTDKDFKQIFLMGDQLPDVWRDRILALLETVPQAVPVFEPEGQDTRQLLRELIPTFRDPAYDVIAQYRIDDDDAVATDFIAESRNIFAKMHSFFEVDGIAGIDFTRGFIMGTSEEGVSLRPVSSRFWAPGLVVFQRSKNVKSVFEFPHLRIWHDMPSLTWKETPMYIRGAHHDNDSGLGDFARRSKSFSFNPQNINRYMKRRFGMELRDLRDVWDKNKDYFMESPAAVPVAKQKKAS